MITGTIKVVGANVITAVGTESGTFSYEIMTWPVEWGTVITFVVGTEVI